MYHQRKFKPRNPGKYKGDPTTIVNRSSWETKFCIWLDQNPSVLEWNSEEVVIPYICPTDNKMHRYFVDMFVKIKDKQGQVKKYLVEIKPKAQTQPPKTQTRKTKRYIKEVMTWGKNQAKWKAAKRFAKLHDMEFLILTEDELGIN